MYLIIQVKLLIPLTFVCAVICKEKYWCMNWEYQKNHIHNKCGFQTTFVNTMAAIGLAP